MKWLAILDMDGTILEHRTVDVLCEKLGLTEQLMEIDRKSKFMDAQRVSERIAELFSGIRTSKLETTFDSIAIVKGAKDFVNFLKSRDFVVAIVTDSYISLASRLAQRLGVDEVKGNKLESVNGVLTGKIAMPLGWAEEKRESCQRKAVCKLHAMNDLMKKYHIKDDRTLAVGDSKSDFCVIKEAYVGIAFRPKDNSIKRVSNVVIRTDFCDLIEWLKDFLDSLVT
ncbi:MAG: HAD family phosphatase [Candidatus Bathyarchaeota archaeon]|jgi:phosphoserine phosphatase